VQSDSQDSLKADTILRSILRQRLDVMKLPARVEEVFSGIDISYQVDQILELLRLVMPKSTVSYVLVDGLDECLKRDRSVLLRVLKSLSVDSNHIRIFLSSRAGLLAKMRKSFTAFEHIFMDCRPAHNDIFTYVNDIVDDMLEEGELVVGEPSIVEETKSTLINGAQGM
jgi:hypothetical protein